MNNIAYKRKYISIVVATMLATTAGVSLAAPTVTRLTPPSNTISADATTLSRFLPGQGFDLQANVTADVGTTITGFEF
jgi:alkaline phosphatase